MNYFEDFKEIFFWWFVLIIIATLCDNYMQRKE